MNNHQSLKAEIDTREDNFSSCISLGKELLAKQHYASADIKDKLLHLTNQRNALLRRWEERWENLQLSKFYNYYIIHLVALEIKYIPLTPRGK
jgi:spectrin beta